MGTSRLLKLYGGTSAEWFCVVTLQQSSLVMSLQFSPVLTFCSSHSHWSAGTAGTHPNPNHAVVRFGVLSIQSCVEQVRRASHSERLTLGFSTLLALRAPAAGTPEAFWQRLPSRATEPGVGAMTRLGRTATLDSCDASAKAGISSPMVSGLEMR